MAEHSITVQGGSSVRLKTAGKYCDRDIVVTAEGGGAAKCTIALNVYDANFSIWWADRAYTNLSSNDHPSYIEVEGDQMVAVFVSGMSGGVSPSGCVGWGSSTTIPMDGSYMYGLLFFLHVSGSDTTGSIDIYGY